MIIYTIMIAKLPDFLFEAKLWKEGFRIVAGVDEVGRGCFAGPIVAGCVIFSAMKQFNNGTIIINDSKKLKPRQREIAEKWIKENCLAWGIGEASVAEINRFGIKKASEIAFRQAIANCKTIVDYLLIDAFYIPFVRGLGRKSQLAIIDGDEKSISIAAASVIAKVYRDKLMASLNSKYNKFGWGRNKGYGTREHQEAIKKYGITKYHRKVFVNSFFSSQAQLNV
ncbi:ribonuclease HII [Candidatus Woesebacteria bacterium]|nr:ribonuclease HII [Candidatus Woesebacteria bacterium]